MDNGVDIIRRIYEGFDLGDLAPLLDTDAWLFAEATGVTPYTA